MASDGEGGLGGRGGRDDEESGGAGTGEPAHQETVGSEATDRLPAPHGVGGFVAADSGHTVNTAQETVEAMDAQEIPPANSEAATLAATVSGGPTRSVPGNGADVQNPWGPAGSHEAAAPNGELPSPLIDGCVFKARIRADQSITAGAEWKGYLAQELECRGIVAHFDNPENFLPTELLRGYSNRHIRAPTLAHCRADETLVSNNDIVGAVVGIAPNLVHHMSSDAWTSFKGLLADDPPVIKGYTVIGLTSGIDLAALEAEATEKEEIDLAVLQGSALAQMAAIAVKTGLPLVLVLLKGPVQIVDPFAWALEILRQVPGWTKEHKVIVTQFWGTPAQANNWLTAQPRSWFSLTAEYVSNASIIPEDEAWLCKIPWDFLIGESLAPIGGTEGANDPSSMLELVSSLENITDEEHPYIYQELARSCVKAYDLDQDHPDILARTRVNNSTVFPPRLSVAQYLSQLPAAPQGLAAAQLDAIRRVEIPAAPRGRRAATRAPAPAAAQAAQAAPANVAQAAPAAAAQAALAAAQQAAPAARASVLPDVPFDQDLVPLAQAALFDVTDQSRKGWEFNRMCPDHTRGLRGQRMRTHPTVAEIVPRYVNLTKFPKDEGMRDRASRVGRRVIYSLHHMLVVIVAGRILRQEEFKGRVIAFLEAAMNIDAPENLVVPTTDFLRNVRERAHEIHEEALRRGEKPGDPQLGKYGFGDPDTTHMIQFWVCRCETGHDYFYENPHGPISWQTAGYDGSTDPVVRQSFNDHVRDYFPTAMNLVRHREYVQHVLGKAPKVRGWPPMPPSFMVDQTKCLWSETVVFMDDWSANSLSRGLRRDITCISLTLEPRKAYDKLYEYFFAHTVQRIVIFYGADALYEGQKEDITQLHFEAARHLTRHFGRARVYLYCPPYVLSKHQAWEFVVGQEMLHDNRLQALANVVSYPLDRRLCAFFNATDSDHWPAEARLEQDESANLSDHGIANRKSDAVLTHGLNLWSELTEDELSQEEIYQIAMARVHETPTHFGRPTIRVPDYEERIKRKKKEAPPSNQQASARTPSGSKRPAERQLSGSQQTSQPKRGKGPQAGLSSRFGSQLSIRSDQPGSNDGVAPGTVGVLSGTPITNPAPDAQDLLTRLYQNPRAMAALRAALEQAESADAPPAPSTRPPAKPTAVNTAQAQPRRTRRQSNRARDTSPWPSENRHLPYSCPADDFVNDDDMVIVTDEDDDVGQVPAGTRPAQDPATPTDTVSTVTSAAETSANTGTSDEAASKTATKTGSDSSSAAVTSSSPSTTTTTSSTESTTASTSTSTAATSSSASDPTTSAEEPAPTARRKLWTHPFIPRKSKKDRQDKQRRE